MSRRIQREDPAYLQAMREAKELFDAAIAKNSMKGRGRPAKVAVAAPSEVIDDEIDVSDVIAEAMVETDEHEIPPPAPAPPATSATPAGKAGKTPLKSATRSPAKAAAKSPAKIAKVAKASKTAKPVVKKSPVKKAAAPKKKR